MWKLVEFLFPPRQNTIYEVYVSVRISSHDSVGGATSHTLSIKWRRGPVHFSASVHFSSSVHFRLRSFHFSLDVFGRPIWRTLPSNISQFRNSLFECWWGQVYYNTCVFHYIWLQHWCSSMLMIRLDGTLNRVKRGHFICFILLFWNKYLKTLSKQWIHLLLKDLQQQISRK